MMSHRQPSPTAKGYQDDKRRSRGAQDSSATPQNTVLFKFMKRPFSGAFAWRLLIYDTYLDTKAILYNCACARVNAEEYEIGR